MAEAFAHLAQNQIRPELSSLYLTQFGLHVPSQLRTREMRQNLLDQRNSLARGHELLAITDDIGEVNQTLDDRSAGRLRPQTSSFHCVPQFVVIKLPARGLHG